MLKHGYINFFENQCCFIADDLACGAVDLTEKTHLLLDDKTTAVTLQREGNCWFLLEDPKKKRIQGLQVWCELPDTALKAE